MNASLKSIPYFSVLSQEDLHLLDGKIEERNYNAGDVILSPGKICRYLFFVSKGLVYSYANNETEQILWYEAERSFFTDLESCYNNTPSNNYIVTAEDNTVLLAISHEDIQGLFRTSNSLAVWGVKFFQSEIVRLTRYYEDLRVKDATQRYHDFVKKFPEALQRIPLRHIASYLGISPVSISRIRANHQKK